MTDPHDDERRTHPRKASLGTLHPILKVDGQEYNVLDYSRNGIRIMGGNHYPLSGWIKGDLCLAGHKPIHIDAIVIRRKEGAVGLRLIVPIALNGR